MHDEALKPKPDCAVCGNPYHRHNIGSHVLCPIIATYRPLPPANTKADVERVVLGYLRAAAIDLEEGLTAALPEDERAWLLRRRFVDAQGSVNAAISALSLTRTAGGEEVELRTAAQGILDRKTSTYKARNGRDVGIEADDGEKCWIVHSDDIHALEAALATPQQVKEGRVALLNRLIEEEEGLTPTEGSGS